MIETILRIEDLNENIGGGYVIITDRQSITLAIDNYQDCCESWGYFWSNDNPDDFIGALLLDVKITDSQLGTREIEDLDSGGDVMFIDIITNRGVLQFTAYNSHNGYYSHSAWVKSEQLKYDTYL